MMRLLLILLASLLLIAPVTAQEEDSPVTYTLQTVFADQGQGYRDMVFAPDGETLALATMKGIWLYDRDLNPLRLLAPTAETTTVEDIAWSPDGTRIAGDNGFNRYGAPTAPTLHVWDADTSDIVATLDAITSDIQVSFVDLSWSPDGALLAGWASPEDGQMLMRVWRVDDASILSDAIIEVGVPRWSPTFSWEADSSAFTFDVVAQGANAQDTLNRFVITVDGEVSPVETDEIRRQFLSPDGRFYIERERGEGFRDVLLMLFDANTGNVLGELTLNAEELRFFNLHFIWFADRVVGFLSDSPQSFIATWDLNTLAPIYEVPGAFGALFNTVTQDPNDQSLAYVADSIGFLTVYILQSGERLNQRAYATQNIIDLALSPDGTTLATVNVLEPTVRLWDLASGENTSTLIADDFIVDDRPLTLWNVAWSPDGRYIAAGEQATFIQPESDIRVHVWDAETGAFIRSLVMPQNALADFIMPLHFSPDSTHIAAARPSNQTGQTRVSVWEIETGDMLVNLDFPGGQDIAWLPDGSGLLVTGATDDRFNEYVLWQLALDGSEPIAMLEQEVRRMAWRPGAGIMGSIGTESSQYAISDFEGNVTIMDGDTPLTAFSTEQSRAWLFWSPDGDVLATFDDLNLEETALQLWSVSGDGTTAELILSIPAPPRQLAQGTGGTAFEWLADGNGFVYVLDGVHVYALEE